jgi:hypothetical protein
MTELKIMPVTLCGMVGKCKSSPSSYGDYLPNYMSHREKTPEVIAPYAMQQLEAARAKDLATHEANLPALENNKLIAAQIIALNESVGMPKRWSERDHNSRARYPKTIGHDAGYLTDIAREVKTEDGFVAATCTYERMKKDYEAYAEQGKRHAEVAARAKESERLALVEKRKADMELATLLIRYSLPPESDWSDVLDHLRTKDQRIDLAVAMSQTRGDWSEGPYRVSNALHGFSIQNDEDKEIAADVASCLYDFDDGRVFRDTTWNYDRLFASVSDQQLSTDAQLADSRCRSE